MTRIAKEFWPNRIMPSQNLLSHGDNKDFTSNAMISQRNRFSIPMQRINFRISNFEFLTQLTQTIFVSTVISYTCFESQLHGEIFLDFACRFLTVSPRNVHSSFQIRIIQIFIKTHFWALTKLFQNLPYF